MRLSRTLTSGGRAARLPLSAFPKLRRAVVSPRSHGGARAGSCPPVVPDAPWVSNEHDSVEARARRRRRRGFGRTPCGPRSASTSCRQADGLRRPRTRPSREAAREGDPARPRPPGRHAPRARGRPLEAPPEEAKGAVDRAMEVIRNRIDQFGVAEPIIQKRGRRTASSSSSPASPTAQRAIELIGKTALLEFKLVRTPDEAQAMLQPPRRRARRARPRRPVAGRHGAARRSRSPRYFIDHDGRRRRSSPRPDVPTVEAMLDGDGLDIVVPARLAGPVERPTRRSAGRTGRWLYVRQARARDDRRLGSRRAQMRRSASTQTNPGAWGVSHEASPGKGQADFARVTGRERRPPARDRARRRRALGALDPRAHPERQRLDHRLVRRRRARRTSRSCSRRRAAGAGQHRRGALGRTLARPGLDRRRLQGGVDRHAARGRVHARSTTRARA